MKPKKTKRKVLSPLKLRRHILHMLLGFLILYTAKNHYWNIRWILFTILIIGIMISFISLRFRLPFIYFMLKRFEKPQYIRKFPGKGALFFIAGCLLVLKLFPKSMALSSIAILTFADPIASISGVLFGRLAHKKPFNTLKKIEGTIVGIAAGFFAASFFVSYLEAIAASLAAMIAEALTLRLGGDYVDDNITVPLAAATVIYLKFKFFPFL